MFGICKKIFWTVILILVTNFSTTSAEKIIFIPHDDRPISYHQTIEVVEQLGYEIVYPPKNLLNDFSTMGHADELWGWLFENVHEADCAVLASDSLLYGGLIPSRKHEVSAEVLNQRLENFSKLHEQNKNLKIYIFDSLMRTPQNGTKGDIEEPEYYAQYGADIFQYSSLADKQEISGLNLLEEMAMQNHKSKIPEEIFSNWLERRQKNLDATKKLIELTAENVIDYLIIGRDDNSELSQTHKEHREIISCAEKNNLPPTKFQCMPGIDEFNLLLLTRAVNEMRGEVPKVNVQFNSGKGGATVPAFSDEEISVSVDASITIAGAERVFEAADADFVFLVNTDADGATLWGHNPVPDGSDFKPNLDVSLSTQNFLEIVEQNLEKNYPVGIADISFANGSDNALMNLLQEKNLLYKFQSYSGWNTATNSTGFALATGILARHMSDTSKQKLLTRRYLDDWGYQANVRTIVGNEIVKKFNNPALYYQFYGQRDWAENLNTKLLKDFAKKNLPHFNYLKNFKVKNPWNRMFECDIEFAEGR